LRGIRKLTEECELSFKGSGERLLLDELGQHYEQRLQLKDEGKRDAINNVNRHFAAVNEFCLYLISFST